MANRAADNPKNEELVRVTWQVFGRQKDELGERNKVSGASEAVIVRRALDFYFTNCDRRGVLKPNKVRLIAPPIPYQRKQKVSDGLSKWGTSGSGVRVKRRKPRKLSVPTPA